MKDAIVMPDENAKVGKDPVPVSGSFDGNSVLRECGSLIIWGYDWFGRQLMDLIQLRYGLKPLCFIDPDPSKHSLTYREVRCIAPEDADGFGNDDTVFLIASQNNWEEIYESLLYRGVNDARILRCSQSDMAFISCSSRKMYQTGLLMGVFDLFHIGHLNLIRRAKENCRFLRVAVMSDELTCRFKGKYPVIPQDQRMEILRAVRYVDEVVLIEDDPSRLKEWDRRRFDCFFSGDDYRGNSYWEWEKTELRKRGADIVFFPYTQEQSSTDIRKKLTTENGEEA